MVSVRDVALTSWRDLAAHWRRPATPVSRLWPLWAALAVLALAVLLFVGAAFDISVARAAAKLDPGLIVFFDYVTQAGKSNWLFALSILAIITALSRRERAATRRLRAAWGLVASYALYFLAVQAVSGTASQVVKHLVGRARPRLIEIAGPFHFDLFSLKAVLASFPSGHTTTVFAACGALSLLSPRLGPWVLLLAVPVAASRVIVGAHYPSDVCGGPVPRARLGAAGGAGSGAAQDRLHPRARRAAAHAARKGADRPDLAEGSGLSAHPLKALVEIRLQVLDVFEAD